jgi:hypothetical protein
MADASIRLELVEDMPGQFAPGILYVSEEYEIACHLCACGCGSPVYTPLDAAEWSFKNEGGKPSLRPSIGNWTLPCRSHYWIKSGRINWARNWSDNEVEAGRRAERKRRDAHLRSTPDTIPQAEQLGWFARAARWLDGK